MHLYHHFLYKLMLVYLRLLSALSRCFVRNAFIFGPAPPLGCTAMAHVQATLKTVPFNNVASVNALAIIFSGAIGKKVNK